MGSHGKYAKGGIVNGPGGPKNDSGIAGHIDNGFVVPKAQVKKGEWIVSVRSAVTDAR